MTYVYSLLKYLAIGICLGIGILLADQLYFKYGNPHQIAIMEELLEELYESQSDLIDLGGLSSFPSFSFHVFGKSVSLEERCTIYLQELPAVRCQDRPHSTSVTLSRRGDDFDAQIENVQRISVDGTFRDEERKGFRVIRWFTDIEKLSEVLSELRTDNPPEQQGTRIEFPELPPTFNSMVCDEDRCITIRSASRTKVKGLVAQIVEE